ncbi:MAG TPA: hypothetical protein VEF55_01555, partial [Candidatus Binatia bacterium]|nr:hypothetical protein [Candidatus Binatia bacterium]
MRRGTQGFDYFLAAPLVGPDDLIWDASYLTDMMARWSGAGESVDPNALSPTLVSVCTFRPAPLLDSAGGKPEEMIGPPGPRQINESGGDVIPGDISTSFTLTMGVPETGVINSVGDSDWFRVTLTANTVNTITVSSPPPFGLASATISLYSSTGTLLTTHAGPTWPSLIVGGSGDYFIGVSGSGGA